jgi:hypothetical protein
MEDAETSAQNRLFFMTIGDALLPVSAAIRVIHITLRQSTSRSSTRPITESALLDVRKRPKKS